MSRSVRYTSSPLLASKTPVGRSRFIVAAIALGFIGLGVRAAYVQVYANDFFQRQGTVRFARTLELPANRGRILDRNGLILASSVPAASIWAIPEDVDESDPTVRAQLKELAQLLDSAGIHGIAARKIVEKLLRNCLLKRSHTNLDRREGRSRQLAQPTERRPVWHPNSILFCTRQERETGAPKWPWTPEIEPGCRLVTETQPPIPTFADGGYLTVEADC